MNCFFYLLISYCFLELFNLKFVRTENVSKKRCELWKVYFMWSTSQWSQIRRTFCLKMLILVQFGQNFQLYKINFLKCFRTNLIINKHNYLNASGSFKIIKLFEINRSLVLNCSESSSFGFLNKFEDQI